MLGDPTARDMGRMSLNPGVHIDIVGTLILPLLGTLFGGGFFGWAKPVPVNPYNLKNPRKDMMLIAAAGPFMNIVLTFAILGVVKLLLTFTAFDPAGSPLHAEINRQLIRTSLISVFLAAFNMLPLFPLDGFSVVRGLAPRRYSAPIRETQSVWNADSDVPYFSTGSLRYTELCVRIFEQY